MIAEAYTTVKIMMTQLEKSTGHTFSKVDPDATLEGVFLLAKGISTLKRVKYDDFYYVTDTCLEEE